MEKSALVLIYGFAMEALLLPTKYANITNQFENIMQLHFCK